ncbi:hypothetical protein [Candidatus Viadribacter manganicus]|uniref:Uncharacterized protein n=1 Tax=Candidatus Viadribacter manganicus TaxID=1759059 RepID=A0A1B1AM45_9PROT|nr:hypothetical protein [Candidatus Viadribacter manganicus]ANP47639.1 hypothetical protein ATE48_17900 [Candidatus Viadribacter manganicus]
MFRSLIVIAALGLAACAAPAANPVVHVPAPSADLACNAGDVRQCPAGGCTGENPGEQSTLYISLEVPARGGAGRFCIATGCEDATFTARPTNSGFGYIMRTNDRTEYAAALDIAPDERTFTLSQANDGAPSTWTGQCSVAGS